MEFKIEEYPNRGKKDILTIDFICRRQQGRIGDVLLLTMNLGDVVFSALSCGDGDLVHLHIYYAYQVPCY